MTREFFSRATQYKKGSAKENSRIDGRQGRLPYCFSEGLFVCGDQIAEHVHRIPGVVVLLDLADFAAADHHQEMKVLW
jgi:hypothetical protein